MRSTAADNSHALPLPCRRPAGKIIWARHNEVQTVNVKSLGDAEEVR